MCVHVVAMQTVAVYVPLLCLGAGLVPSSAKAGKAPSAPKTSEKVSLGNPSNGKEHNKYFESLFDYYMNTRTSNSVESSASGTRGENKRREDGKKLRKGASKKAISAAAQTPSKSRDAVVAEVEFLAAIAIGVVSLVAVLAWKSQSRDAHFGLETRIQDIAPPKNPNTDSNKLNMSNFINEKTKEELMLEASKRIARAKELQEKYKKNSSSEVEDNVAGETSKLDQEIMPLKMQEKENVEVFEQENATAEDEIERSPTQNAAQQDLPNLGAFAFALFSVIGGGLVRELIKSSGVTRRNGRVLVASYARSTTGKQMRVESEQPEGVDSDKLWSIEDILIAPMMPMIKDSWKMKPTSLIKDKYNPIFDIQRAVNEMDDFKNPGTDPLRLFLSSLANFDGLRFRYPEIWKKYDPFQTISRISIENESNPIREVISSAPKEGIDLDPFRQLLHAASRFKGPKVAQSTKKYDILQNIDQVKIPKGGSNYSLLQILLHSNPAGHKFDPWKSVVNMDTLPLINGEQSGDLASSLLQGIQTWRSRENSMGKSKMPEDSFKDIKPQTGRNSPVSSEEGLDNVIDLDTSILQK